MSVPFSTNLDVFKWCYSVKWDLWVDFETLKSTTDATRRQVENGIFNNYFT